MMMINKKMQTARGGCCCDYTCHILEGEQFRLEMRLIHTNDGVSRTESQWIRKLSQPHRLSQICGMIIYASFHDMDQLVRHLMVPIEDPGTRLIGEYANATQDKRWIPSLQTLTLKWCISTIPIGTNTDTLERQCTRYNYWLWRMGRTSFLYSQAKYCVRIWQSAGYVFAIVALKRHRIGKDMAKTIAGYMLEALRKNLELPL